MPQNKLNPANPFSTESDDIMNPHKLSRTFVLIAAALMLAGCTRSTRSISHSIVPPGTSHPRIRAGTTAQTEPFTYRGELSEFDLLGIDRDQRVTDEQITTALEGAERIRLMPGENILLVQSGAAFPDGEMVRELEAHFRVIPFSGVPSERMRSGDGRSDQPAYARSFRLAAARAGARHIVCYWGALESMRTDMDTKTISWIPFAGWVIPDENQAMRIQLKLAVIDVQTGGWTTLAATPFVDENSRSNRFNRDRADQRQVRDLKNLAYAAGVRTLVERLDATTK